jgi:CRISPR-associated exonuclease Cas4
MPKITGNLINAYYVCKRKLWLYAHEIGPDRSHQLLEIGRLYDQSTYKRDKKQISMSGMKIDILKKRDGELLVGEVKKTSKFEAAAKMQLAYYLYRLKEQGIELDGELLVPKEKKRERIILDDALTQELETAIAEIDKIITSDKPPVPEKTKYCGKCAYSDFCWS